MGEPIAALDGRDHLHQFKYDCNDDACEHEGVNLHCYICKITLSEFRANEEEKDAQRQAEKTQVP